MARCQLNKSGWVDNSISLLGYSQPDLVIQLSVASTLEVIKLSFPRVISSGPRRGCKAGENGWEMTEGQPASLRV